MAGPDDTELLEASRHQGPKPVVVDGLRSSSQRPAGGGCEHERQSMRRRSGNARVPPCLLQGPSRAAVEAAVVPKHFPLAATRLSFGRSALFPAPGSGP